MYTRCWESERDGRRIKTHYTKCNFWQHNPFHCSVRYLGENRWLMALFHCMVRHGTVRHGSLLGGFPLGTVPGTWYFFSTTSVEVPSSRTVTKTWRVNSADHWMAGENRHYCVTELATRDPPLPARFKSAQPAKDRTQLLFKQTHIFASTTK